MELRKTGLLVLALALLFAGAAGAQNPTGALTGRVTDDTGGALPGVAVSATSPALQGQRDTFTTGNGDYKVPFLSPGVYQVTYELEGFNTVVREVKISAAQITPSDITMEVGTVTEQIVVTSQQAVISETTTGSATVTFDEIDDLPVARDFSNAVRLAPGVSNSSFRSSAPVIAGAPSYENLFMINGVVVSDNIRNTILDLFIEDAIQETTTSVTGISAEYGRFTGGVVNAITKSGGNTFDGSLRLNLTNEDWESKTPLSGDRVDDVGQSYEGTLGGYFWKDRLWFFGAGRDRSLDESRQTDITNIQYPYADEETRTEIKLTISPHPSHSILGSYQEIERTRMNTDFGTILDVNSLNANRGDPQELQSVNYTGILTQNFFIEGQWSERDYIIGAGSGGVPELINGTLIRTRNESFRYWAPTFCGTCEDEQRDSENLLVKGSYFLTTSGAGTHDLVFGYDTFEDIRAVINHQTGSDFTVYGSDIVRDSAGDIVLDPATGSPYPVFDPDAGAQPWVRWFAVFNEDLARPTSFATNSFYFNDTCQLNDKWSFNVGARWDENDGVDSAGFQVAADDKISQRMAVNYDLKGTGDLVLRATWGTYVAGLANGVADDASPGGAIGSLRYNYRGAPINVGCTPGVDCLSSPEVLRQVFDWYAAAGGVFDLNQFDPANPFNQPPFRNSFSIPGETLQPAGIDSPAVEEWTVGISKRLGSRGLIRADLVLRDWEDFYGIRRDLSTGPTSDGLDDLGLLGNFANGVSREYQGLITHVRYRPSDRLSLNLNYTLSQLEGNFVGETVNSGPVSAATQSYPEYKQARWNYPKGDLRSDQRHTARAWAIYNLVDTQRHKLSVSWLENFFSGQPYAANGSVDPRGDGSRGTFIVNPGYNDPPSSLTYFFTPRDGLQTDDIHRSDLSLNYSLMLPIFGRDVEIFVQPEVLNLFNEDGVFDPHGLDDGEGVSVLRGQIDAVTGREREFNPNTETPVEGVDWEKNSNFGTPLNESDYQTPRTFRLSVGFRF